MSIRHIVFHFVLALAIPQGASAQSLFEQGASLLKSLGSSTESTLGGGALANDEIIAGLKEALKIGTGNVVGQLGARGGFNNDANIRIPLPDTLKQVRDALAPFGYGELLDDLEVRLNRAAEDATPKAKTVFWDAIGAMTLEDAKRIYQGPDDAATQYFKRTMSTPLAESWQPIVDESLSGVGAIEAYDNALGQYSKLPFMPDVKADLSKHVIERGLDGVFLYLAKEEAAIRSDPLKRSTELLQKVFGR